jgi:hypothetical protein
MLKHILKFFKIIIILTENLMLNCIFLEAVIFLFAFFMKMRAEMTEIQQMIIPLRAVAS